MSDESINIQICITKLCYKKLQEQLEFFKKAELREFQGIDSPENLIARYLEQMTSCEEHYKMVQSKMQDVINVLNEKGVDMLDLFNSLNEQFEEEKKKKKPTSPMKKN